MSENKKTNEAENIFPLNYTNYYYRYEIFNLKKVKAFYNSINTPILFSYKSIDSPWDNYVSIDGSLSKDDIYNEYEKLYNDFNYYIDKLINKFDINNDMDFKETIELLLVNVAQLNEFIHLYLIFNANKNFYTQKVLYNGNPKKIKSLLLLNSDLLYKINSDNLMYLITKFYSNSIYLGILIGFFILAMTFKAHFSGVILGIGFIVLAIIYLRCHNKMVLYEKLEPFYVAKYSYVAHPLSKKIKFKDITTALSLIKDITPK